MIELILKISLIFFISTYIVIEMIN